MATKNEFSDKVIVINGASGGVGMLLHESLPNRGLRLLCWPEGWNN
jgi:short-subunit dehydrogenase